MQGNVENVIRSIAQMPYVRPSPCYIYGYKHFSFKYTENNSLFKNCTAMEIHAQMEIEKLMKNVDIIDNASVIGTTNNY